MKINKYYLTIFLIAGLFIAGHVLALDAGLSYGTSTGLGSGDLRTTVGSLINNILKIIGLIFIIIILISGTYYMLSQGDEEKKVKAKKILISAISGLVIIILAYAIASFIINGLLERKPKVRGDFDGDGLVTPTDEMNLRLYIMGDHSKCTDPAVNCIELYDLDGDGDAGPGDLTIIRQIIMNQ